MASPVKDAKNKHVADGFTEIAERGRGYLRSRKPGTNQYALTTQVGGVGWHRGTGPYTETDEVDTAWVDNGTTYDMLLGDPFQAQVNLAQQSYRYEDMDTGESVELFAESVLQWTNGSQTQTAAGLSSPTTSANDDTITFEGLFGSGSRLSIQAQTARLKKLLTIDNDTVLSTPTLSGTVSLSFSLRFQRSNGVSLWVDGVEWDEKANNPQSTSSAVEFRNTAGDTLFVFSPVYATDNSVVSQENNTNRQDGVMALKKAGANLFADVLIPYSWIQTAVYPIVIDPTVEEQVGAGADDATQVTWSFNHDGDDLNIHAGATDRWDSGARFQTVAVPNAATIDVAYYEGYTAGPTNVNLNCHIYGEDVDDSADFATTADVSSRTRTTANVDWAETLSNNTWEGSDKSIISIVQEIVDRAGWATGQDMTILLIGDDTGGDKEQAQFDTYDVTTTEASKLHIEYTAPASGDTITLSHPSITSSAHGSAVTPGAVSLVVDALTLASAVPSSSVTPGAVSLVLQALSLASSAQTASVTAGAVLLALNALSLSGSSLGASASSGAILVALQALSITSSVLGSSVTPGAVSLLMSALTLSSSGLGIGITAPSPGAASIALSVLTLASSVDGLSVTPGAVSVLLDLLSATGAIPSATVSSVIGAIEIVLSSLGITATAESATITPGAVQIALDELNLTSSSYSAGVQSAIAVIKSWLLRTRKSTAWTLEDRDTALVNAKTYVALSLRERKALTWFLSGADR